MIVDINIVKMIFEKNNMEYVTISDVFHILDNTIMINYQNKKDIESSRVLKAPYSTMYHISKNDYAKELRLFKFKNITDGNQ